MQESWNMAPLMVSSFLSRVPSLAPLAFSFDGAVIETHSCKKVWSSYNSGTVSGTINTFDLRACVFPLLVCTKFGVSSSFFLCSGHWPSRVRVRVASIFRFAADTPPSICHCSPAVCIHICLNFKGKGWECTRDREIANSNSETSELRL